MADHASCFEMAMSFVYSFSTCGIAVAGFMAISAWREQTRSREDHDLSRALLRASYALRDGIQFIRNPFSWTRQRDDAGNLLSAEAQHEQRVKLYSDRVKEAQTRRSDLEAKISETEALWGEDVRSWFMPLIAKHAEVVTAVEMVLDLESPRSPRQPNDNNKELYAEQRAVFYSRSHSKPDAFDAGVIAALNAIREKLKPRMIR